MSGADAVTSSPQTSGLPAVLAAETADTSTQPAAQERGDAGPVVAPLAAAAKEGGPASTASQAHAAAAAPLTSPVGSGEAVATVLPSDATTLSSAGVATSGPSALAAPQSEHATSTSALKPALAPTPNPGSATPDGTTTTTGGAASPMPPPAPKLTTSPSTLHSTLLRSSDLPTLRTDLFAQYSATSATALRTALSDQLTSKVTADFQRLVYRDSRVQVDELVRFVEKQGVYDQILDDAFKGALAKDGEIGARLWRLVQDAVQQQVRESLRASAGEVASKGAGEGDMDVDEP